MATNLENLSIQLQELDALASMFFGRQFEGLPEKVDAVVRSLVEQDVPLSHDFEMPLLGCSLKLPDDLGKLRVTFPVEYPTAAPPFFVYSSSMFSRSDVFRANADLSQHAGTHLGDECVWACVDFLENYLKDPPWRSGETESNAPPKTDASSKRKIRQRAFMWTHHIYSKFKKKDIKGLASRLGLHGFCVTGKPGILVYEGTEAAVVEAVTILKNMQWQKFIVRFTQEEKLDECEERFPSFSFHDFPATKSDLGLVRRLLKSAELASSYDELIGMDVSLTSKTSHADGKNSPTIKNTGKKNSKWKMKKGTDPPGEGKPWACLSSSKDGEVVLCVGVRPNARSSAIRELPAPTAPELPVDLAAPPRDGKANKELCALIAGCLGIGKTRVVFRNGGKSKSKSVRILELTLKEVQDRLIAAADS